MLRPKLIAATFCLIATSTLATKLHAQTPYPPASAAPTWSPVIVATGAYRDQIRSTPIQYRPNRPLHFYGNAVRRLYWGGTPAIAVVPRGAVVAAPVRYVAEYPTSSELPYPTALPPWGTRLAVPAPTLVSPFSFPPVMIPTIQHGGISYTGF